MNTTDTATQCNCDSGKSDDHMIGCAADIAGRLSEEGRHFLPQLKRRGFSIHPGMQTLAVRNFLRDAERLGLLTNPSFDNYFLTDLGIAVRRALTEGEG